MKIILPLNEAEHRALWMALFDRELVLENSEDCKTEYVQTQLNFLKQLREDLDELLEPTHMVYNLLDKKSKHA